MSKEPTGAIWYIPREDGDGFQRSEREGDKEDGFCAAQNGHVKLSQHDHMQCQQKTTKGDR